MPFPRSTPSMTLIGSVEFFSIRSLLDEERMEKAFWGQGRGYNDPVKK